MEEVINEDNKKFGKDLKVILIGNISTGKTSIINRFIKNIFEEKCRATIAPEFSYKVIKYKGANYRLQIWDLPGQERNKEITRLFCQNSDGCIFCCEVKDKKSREDLLRWKESLNDKQEISDLPKIIIENKCDLLGNEEKYLDNFEELKKFSDDNDFDECFRTSALNGYNIENAINFLVEKIAAKLEVEDIQVYKEGEPKIKLKNQSSLSKDNSKKCC